MNRTEDIMPATIHATAADRGGEIVITRWFDAPRALVFEAWSNPAHLAEWFAPKGGGVPHCTVDFRVGGKFHFCMRLDNGVDIWGLGIYREIVAPERIVYLDSFADPAGNVVAPSHYGMSRSHPRESLVTVTFTEDGGRTRLVLHHAIPAGVREQADMRQGWNEMFDRLEQLAAKA